MTPGASCNNGPASQPQGGRPLVLLTAHADMVLDATQHLHTRLGELTLATLTPEQLEKTVRLHLDTQERWLQLNEVQQLDLIAKVITALKK